MNSNLKRQKKKANDIVGFVAYVPDDLFFYLLGISPRRTKRCILKLDLQKALLPNQERKETLLLVYGHWCIVLAHRSFNFLFFPSRSC